MTLFFSSKHVLSFFDLKIITDPFDSVIEKLAHFSSVEEKNISEQILKIINALNNINQLDSNTIHNQAIPSVRAQLYKLLSQNNVKQKDKSLSDIAFDSLLALAKYSPINKNDPISCDEIEESDKIFVSTGHQFSLNSLIDYHNARGYRGSSLGEQSNSKWLLNPLTNDKFHPKDAAHIKAIANNRNIIIENLKSDETNNHLNSHSFLSSPSFPFSLFDPSDLQEPAPLFVPAETPDNTYTHLRNLGITHAEAVQQMISSYWNPTFQ